MNNSNNNVVPSLNNPAAHLINQTDDFIWSVNIDYTLQAANEPFIRQIESVTGIVLKPGDNVLDTDKFPEDLISTYRKLYDKAAKGQSFREEIFSVLNGQRMWSEVNFNRLYQGDKIIGIACFSRDITEKKLAEEKLRESEALLAEAQRLANIGSWNFDLFTGQLTWSDELYRVFETNVQTFDETLNSFLHFIIPEDRARVLESSKLSRETGEPFTTEYQIVTGSGARKYIEEHGSAQKDEYGEVVRLFGTAQDITKQVEAKQKVEFAERQLEVIFNTVSDIIFMLSVEDVDQYRFVAINNMFLTATNLSREQVIDKCVHEIIPSPSLELVLSKYRQAIDQRTTVSWQEQTVYPSGIKHGAVTVSPVFDDAGKCILLVGSVHDITEQKRSEQELILSEEKYRHLFEHSPMPMWIFDIDTLNFLEVNPAAIDHYGFTKEEFLSMTLEEIRLPHLNPHLLNLSKYYTRRTFPNYSFHRKKDGTIIQVQISASTINYESKKARLVLLVDRTEQAATENALVESTQQLRELTSHLQSVREEERTNIAREIHDELGQQLTGLKMDLAWLKRRVKSDDEMINSKISSSLTLVDATINTVRKIASELRPSIIDDLGIAEAIDWQVDQFSKRTGLEAHFESDLQDIEVNEGVPIALFRIVQEALTNITRHADATKIVCSLKRAGNRILLNITDNGKGFDANNTRHKKTLGILGMKERVAMLNGDFEIITRPENGTKVSVSIPLAGD